MWEDVEQGVFRKNRRIRTILKFDHVTKVASKNIDFNKNIKDETPMGNVIMTYNHETESFWYYCDNKSLTYKSNPHCSKATSDCVISNTWTRVRSSTTSSNWKHWYTTIVFITATSTTETPTR